MISVIVPVYNIENWVERCISSLIEQSYKDIEIILVDDESTDGSLAICKKYEKKYDNVKVIHQRNQGLSGARNTGIKIATGDYITFVDGDDYLDRDALNKAYEAIHNSNADMCIFQYDYVEDSGKEIVISNRPFKMDRIVTTGQAAMVSLLTDDSWGGVVAWGKLYRTKLFLDNKILFPVGKIHEDCFTTYKLCFFSNNVIYIPYVGYHYVQRMGSIINSSFSEHHLDKIEAADECIAFVKNNAPSSCDAAEAAAVRWYLQVVNRIMRAKAKRLDVFQNVRSRIKQIDIRGNNKLSKKYKILARIYTRSFTAYRLLLYSFKRKEH